MNPKMKFCWVRLIKDGVFASGTSSAGNLPFLFVCLVITSMTCYFCLSLELLVDDSFIMFWN